MLDLYHPDDPSAVTGSLTVSLEWVPLNAAPPPPAPSATLDRLLCTRRGSVHIRLLRGAALPPVDAARGTCTARVRVRGAGQIFSSPSAQSLFPVWLRRNRHDRATFELRHVSELDEVRLQVLHDGKGTSFLESLSWSARTQVRYLCCGKAL